MIKFLECYPPNKKFKKTKDIIRTLILVSISASKSPGYTYFIMINCKLSLNIDFNLCKHHIKL